MISTKALFDIVRSNDYEKLSNIINQLKPEDLLKTSKKNTSIIPHAIEYRSFECFNILLDSNKFDFKKMRYYSNGFSMALEYYKLAPNEKNMYYVNKLLEKNYDLLNDDNINYNIIYMEDTFRNSNLYELFFPILINSINRSPLKYLKYSLYSVEVFKKLYDYCVNNDLLTNDLHKRLIASIIEVDNYTILRCIDEPYKIEPAILSIALSKGDINIDIVKYLINNGSDYIVEKERLLTIYISTIIKYLYSSSKDTFNIFMLLINNYKFKNIEKIVDDLLNISKHQYINYDNAILFLSIALKLIKNYKSDTEYKFDKIFDTFNNFNFNRISMNPIFKALFEELEKLGFELPKELHFIKALKPDKVVTFISEVPEKKLKKK